MVKFSTLSDLGIHKQLHCENENQNDIEDDYFEEDFVPNSNGNSASISIDEKVKSLDVLRRVDEKRPSPSKPKETTLQGNETKTSSQPNNKVNPPFRCIVCDVFFKTSDEAKSHSPKVTNTKCKFSCHLCNRKFNTLYAFVVHVMQHKTNVAKNQLTSGSMYACSTCDKHFDDCFQLKRHEITTHKKKTSNQWSSRTATLQPTVITEPQRTDVAEQNETEFTCELCYDVFNTKDELDSHTDFHKQLESISEPVIADDTEATVEIIEDFRDKHATVTTIQKAQPNSSRTKINTATLTYDKFSLAPLPTPGLPKQNLTAKIKEMMAPSTENKQKPTKTIFLPNIQPKTKMKPGPKKQVNKKKPRQKQRKPSGLEIERTSQTSFSVKYKDGNGQNPSMRKDVPPSSLPSNFVVSAQPSIGQAVGGSNSAGNNSTMFQNTLLNSLLDAGTSPQTNTFIVCSSAPVNSTNTAPTANTTVPVHSTNPLIANPVSSLSNTSSPSFAYVVIPNSISSVTTTSAVPSTSSNIDGSPPPVQNYLTQTFPANPIPEHQQVLSQAPGNDPVSCGMTLPVIYNVVSLKESTTTEAVSTAQSTTTSSTVVEAALSGSTTTMVVPVSSKMSNVLLSKPLDPNEIICLDSDSEPEEPVGKKEEAVSQNDSDEGGNLVIDDAANRVGKGSNSESHINHQKGRTELAKIAESPAVAKWNEKGSRGNEIDSNDIEKVRNNWKFPMKCDTCDVVLQSEGAMRNHIDGKVSCENCEFKCCRSIDLRIHYMSIHRIYYCWTCKFQTQSQIEYVSHRKSHTCPTCKGVYEELKNHICKKGTQNEGTRSESPITLSE
ncbi:hypothetical protein JTB14_006879 [Gonioctena quinquepunctata]|nr:hypothetical protein JTB14_006879 [Gonioctena quinquepunctata]